MNDHHEKRKFQEQPHSKLRLQSLPRPPTRKHNDLLEEIQKNELNEITPNNNDNDGNKNQNEINNDNKNNNDVHHEDIHDWKKNLNFFDTQNTHSMYNNLCQDNYKSINTSQNIQQAANSDDINYISTANQAKISNFLSRYETKTNNQFLTPTLQNKNFIDSTIINNNHHSTLFAVHSNNLQNISTNLFVCNINNNIQSQSQSSHDTTENFSPSQQTILNIDKCSTLSNNSNNDPLITQKINQQNHDISNQKNNDKSNLNIPRRDIIDLPLCSFCLTVSHDPKQCWFSPMSKTTISVSNSQQKKKTK